MVEQVISLVKQQNTPSPEWFQVILDQEALISVLKKELVQKTEEVENLRANLERLRRRVNKKLILSIRRTFQRRLVEHCPEEVVDGELLDRMYTHQVLTGVVRSGRGTDRVRSCQLTELAQPILFRVA